MKKLIYILNIVSMFFVVSCSYYRKVLVKGEPGTIIYDGTTQVGTIGSTGATKMKLTADRSYYLSKAPQNNLMVPFALDVRDGGLDDDLTIMARVLGYCWLVGLPVLIPSRVDKPLKTQATNHDLFKGYEAHYQPVAEQQPAVANTAVRFHTVVKGDTVQRIAKKYGVSLKQICQLNGFPNSAFVQVNLRVGQILKIK